MQPRCLNKYLGYSWLSLYIYAQWWPQKRYVQTCMMVALPYLGKTGIGIERSSSRLRGREASNVKGYEKSNVFLTQKENTTSCPRRARVDRQQPKAGPDGDKVEPVKRTWTLPDS
eukprot:scaffold26592_cov127-Cylindrotheca_fusiformis.AAC.1